MSQSDIRSLPISSIKIPTLLLRDVQDKSEAFILLMEDIKDHGINVPLNVREVDVEVAPGVTQKAYYLIEGRQRLGAAEKLGLQEVPVTVESYTDQEAMLTMARLNLHRSNPAPAQYAKYLKEILLRQNDMSFKTLADLINQTPEWIRERLRLTDLAPTYSALVDSGEITPLNGIQLAKLDEDDQAQYADRAKSMNSIEFAKIVAERKKEVDKARQSCQPKPAEGFVASRLLRPKAELNALLDQDLSDPLFAQIINDSGATDLPSAVKAAIAWIWQQDATTLAKRKSLWEAEQARLNEEKAIKKIAAEKKKADAQAAKDAAKVVTDAVETQRKLVLS